MGANPRDLLGLVQPASGRTWLSRSADLIAHSPTHTHTHTPVGAQESLFEVEEERALYAAYRQAAEQVSSAAGWGGVIGWALYAAYRQAAEQVGLQGSR